MVLYGESPRLTQEGQQSRLPETEWHRLSRQPTAVPSKPSLDSLVITFLSEHEIQARPPGPPPLNSSETGRNGRLGDALMGGALGAMGGPMAVGIGAHLGQQRKAIKKHEEISRQTLLMQEHYSAVAKWEGWKQWALSHPDWPVFRETVMEEVMFEWEARVKAAELHNQKFFEWLASPEARQEEQIVLAERNANGRSVKTQISLPELAFLISAILFILILVGVSPGFVLVLLIFGLTLALATVILMRNT